MPKHGVFHELKRRRGSKEPLDAIPRLRLPKRRDDDTIQVTPGSEMEKKLRLKRLRDRHAQDVKRKLT